MSRKPGQWMSCSIDTSCSLDAPNSQSDTKIHTVIATHSIQGVGSMKNWPGYSLHNLQDQKNDRQAGTRDV